MAFDKERIRDLLGAGLAPQVVASAVGTDTSYIGQLMADEEFAQAVALLRSKNLEKATVRDGKLDSLEDRLISRLGETLDYFVKPNDIVNALSKVNAMKRRGAVGIGETAVKQQIVQLSIPTVLQQKIVIDSQGEVVEISGQTMIGMPAQQLLNQLQSDPSRKEQHERYKEVSRYLPGAQVEIGKRSGGEGK